MNTLEAHVDVDVPARDAYSQWTQFEDWPRIIANVESVQQLDDRRLDWVVRIGSATARWQSEITEQIPDKRIAWASTAGDARHAGCVTFHRLDEDRCRVMLQIDFEPEGFTQKAADLIGLVDAAVRHALGDFKAFLEAHGAPTGRWEGAIPSPDDR